MEEGTKEYTNITRCSKSALHQYNYDNNTKYQYVRFLKVVKRNASGKVYYITFEAEDKAWSFLPTIFWAKDKASSSSIPTIFQACVFFKIPFRDDCIDVILCRRKADAKPEDNEILLSCSTDEINSLIKMELDADS